MRFMFALAGGHSGTDWAPLFNTALGGVLAIAGGVVGALVAERRADARGERDREHEREVWARGLRYEAHVAFLSIVDAKFSVVQSATLDGTGPEPPDDYLVPVWDRYQSLRIVCTKDTAEKAEKVVEALMAFTFRGGQWEAVEYQRDVYLGAVREEFQLPPIPLMGD